MMPYFSLRRFHRIPTCSPWQIELVDTNAVLILVPTIYLDAFSYHAVTKSRLPAPFALSKILRNASFCSFSINRAPTNGGLPRIYESLCFGTTSSQSFVSALSFTIVAGSRSGMRAYGLPNFSDKSWVIL